jgi:four helix bundle protein
MEHVAGAKKFEELVCWLLADDLKERVYRILECKVVAKDFDYCRQIRKSTRSAPALIAEGFGRWTRPEFVRYLRLALGELGETRNHLRDGLQAKYIATDEYRELWHLCYRASRACRGLIDSLLRKIDEGGNQEKPRK